MNSKDYCPREFYDEYFVDQTTLRTESAAVLQWFEQRSLADIAQLSQSAQAKLKDLGATFRVNGEERALPFDPIPRIIPRHEWQQIEAGLKQRVQAINLFCADVYGSQTIVQAEIIPKTVIESAYRYFPACQGLRPPQDIWCHISGIDLVRDRQGQWRVLEDNVREPSGIAYVIKNREVMQAVMPELLETVKPLPTDDYAHQLKTVLSSLQRSPDGVVGILTKGPSSSSYFEHVYLSEQMGMPLVRPEDLAIREGFLYSRTDRSWQRIEGLYRRGNTEMFAGLNLGDGITDSRAAIIDLCRQGKLAIANTLGAGIADDKVIYAYVPEMIRFYLEAEPILPNVPTYLCWRDRDREYVLDHLDELVVKAASEEGGEGMLMGTQSTPAEREDFAARIRNRPRAYMAQPTIYLSQIPTVIDGQIVPRHTDLRPFVLHQGDDLYVYPGGLTRVALKDGQLVVNSSQGGGSKDTWIVP